MTDQARLDSLWNQVEQARRQWKFAHLNVKQVNEETPAMPSADGSYAHLHALEVQRIAVENYLRALREFKNALASDTAPSPGPAVENGDVITPREREVLKLIASGKSSKEISVVLGIAFRTTVCHRYRLYQKLKVHTSVELTKVALRMGLVEL